MRNKKTLVITAILAIAVGLLTSIDASFSRASLRQSIPTGTKDANGTLKVNTMLLDSDGKFVTGSLTTNTMYTLYVTNRSSVYVDGYSSLESTEKNDFSMSENLQLCIEALDSSATIRPTVTNSYWLFDPYNFGIVSDNERIQITGLAPDETISFNIWFEYIDTATLKVEPEVATPAAITVDDSPTSCRVQLSLTFVETICTDEEIKNFESYYY